MIHSIQQNEALAHYFESDQIFETDDVQLAILTRYSNNISASESGEKKGFPAYAFTKIKRLFGIE
jgi:hypothetical protein